MIDASTTIPDVIKKLIEILHPLFPRGANELRARHADIDTRPALQPLKQVLLRNRWGNAL